MFEYENYEADFLQMKILDRIIQMLILEQGLSAASLPQTMEGRFTPAPKEKFTDQINHRYHPDFLV